MSIPPELVILRLFLAPSLVKPGLAIFGVGSTEGPLFCYEEPAGTIHPHVLVLQSSFLLFPPSSLSIVIIFVRLLSTPIPHLTSSSSTSYRILTNLPPSV
jgi:hypothetical protein